MGKTVNSQEYDRRKARERHKAFGELRHTATFWTPAQIAAYYTPERVAELFDEAHQKHPPAAGIPAPADELRLE